MTTCTSPFDPSYRGLAAAEKLKVCKSWLVNNPPDHEMRSVVEEYLSFLTSPFDPSYRGLAAAEKLKVCKSWLENNPPDHEMRSDVEEYLSLLTQLKEVSTQLNERSLRIVLNKYPKMTDRTQSGFYWPKNSPPSEDVSTAIEAAVFDAIQQCCMSEDYFKSPLVCPLTLNCDHEDQAVLMVQTLLESVLRGMKLDKIFDIALKRSLAGAECDIVLLYKPNRLPFATLEIKKPPYTKQERTHLWSGDPDRGGNRVAGEVWAQMNGIRLFGFHKVYGMISTSNQFKLVCTGSINEESDNMDAMRDAWERLREENLEFAGEPGDEENASQISISPVTRSAEFLNEEFGSRESEARIHSSQIIPNIDDDSKPIVPIEKSGLQILQLLTLFVLKACTTLTQLLTSRQLDTIKVYHKMPCRILKADEENQFSFGTITLNNLNLEVFSNSLAKIHVIHHLGMGDSANCCLGVSESGGSSCAVKFYHQADTGRKTALADAEYKNWEDIYGDPNYGPPMCRKLDIAEGRCLVMPYLRPIPPAQRHNLLDNGTIKRTLQKFAAKGHKQLDMKWRHFGIWKEQIFVLDLGNIAMGTNKEDIDSWIDGALSKLRSTGGKRETKATPKNTRKRKASRSRQENEVSKSNSKR